MRAITKCVHCDGGVQVKDSKWYCLRCGKELTDDEVTTEYVLTPYERNRNAVYSTGNRWAIENWEATH